MRTQALTYVGAIALLPVCSASVLKAQEFCLPIDRIDVRGAELLAPTDLKSLLTTYEGRCLGLTALDEIIKRLTLAYVDRGYVLSRAYLPEQDLSDGVLDVAIVEGELSDIQFDGKRKPRRAAMVFPRMVGKPVDLRDVEQGLEQIQSMPRTSAEMEFVPGTGPGQSELHVKVSQPKPLEVSFTTNNRGQDSTGRWISGLSADAGNLLGFNETLALSYSHTLNPGPFDFGYDGDHVEEYSASLKLPYGRWTFEIGAEGSAYSQTLPGITDPIQARGEGNSQTLSATYMLHRDEQSRTRVEAELTRSESVNYIQGIRLNSSSRVLSNLRLSLSHTRPFWGGHLDGTVFVERGLKVFGAEDGDNPNRTAGLPNPQYTLGGIELSFEKPLKVGSHQLRWVTDLSTQFSTDRLYGSQQFSIGGASTVRGTRIGLASGSSGGFWRNELEYSLPRPVLGKAQVQLYGAVDFGWVQSDPNLNAYGGNATSGTLGARVNYGGLFLDVSYQEVVATSGGLQKPPGEWFVEAAYRF